MVLKSKGLLVGLVAVCIMLIPILGQAGEWTPKGTIKLNIGFGAGGSTDIMGRLIAAKVEEDTGWNVIVENKPGGGGVAMFSTLFRQKPDGLTLGIGVNVPILLNLALRGDKIPFKIDSFDYIGTITKGEIALVAKADAPFDDIQGLLEYGKAKDAILGFDAKPAQMILKSISNQSGVKFKLVGHKSGAEQIQSILGGHIVAGSMAGAHIKYLKSGDMKMIASFNKTRHDYAPEIKTIIETGFSFYVDPYYYIAAPKGLPVNARNTLAKAFGDAIQSDKVKEALKNTLEAKPLNLGPERTLPMMVSGVKDITLLIEASK